jgi:hypothetical protein
MLTTFFERFRTPGALKVAAAALEQCRRDQLEQAQAAEFHAAMVKMLKERELRLVKDVQRLSDAPSSNP